MQVKLTFADSLLIGCFPCYGRQCVELERVNVVSGETLGDSRQPVGNFL